MSSRNNQTRRAESRQSQQHDGKAEQLQIAALASHDTPTDAATEPSDALRNKWTSIVATFDANLQAFKECTEHIRESIKRDERFTFGSDALRSFISRGGFVTPQGTSFCVVHGHDAVYLRELCKRWPDVAPAILPTLHRSRFDDFYQFDQES